jgi:hypothetical protein
MGHEIKTPRRTDGRPKGDNPFGIEDHDPFQDKEMSEEHPDYDPPEHLRVWFRHAQTGDLGYIVKVGGEDMIRLDRPGQKLDRVFKPNDWIAEREARKMSRAQLTQIAFEADKKLCFFLGDHQRARQEWIGLRDEQRIAWIEQGPKTPRVRVELYRAIMAAMERHEGEDE